VGVNLTDRPEPVLAGQIGAAITALIGIAVAFGVNLDRDQQAALLGLVAALVALAGTVGAWRARRQVTPLAAPQDEDGTPLVRADSGEAPGRHRTQG
jgi:flagellar biosynthesis/type III secretory pathway M-ring protein FliF/YscJ